MITDLDYPRSLYHFLEKTSKQALRSDEISFYGLEGRKTDDLITIKIIKTKSRKLQTCAWELEFRVKISYKNPVHISKMPVGHYHCVEMEHSRSESPFA